MDPHRTVDRAQERARIVRALSRLPIFPLPGAVLLPHAQVPLHVFEPRYRKMIRDCADGERVLGLANIPDERAVMVSPPRVEPVLGVGVLGRIDPLPDGRFYIVLRGVMRARVVEEPPSGEPYRVVRATELPDLGDEAAGHAAAELRQLALTLAQHRPSRELAALLQLLARAPAPGDVADLVAGALLEEPGERQAVLEAQDVPRRLALARDAVVAAMALAAPRSSAPN